jgi:RNA recognition motif-containing protein
MHADYTLDLVNSARIVNMTDAAAVAASSSLYVGNLPLLTTQSILQTFCHGAGCPSVYSINLHKNKNKAIESGYGFVHFRDHDSARIAFALLENKTMGENRLVVNWSFGKGGTKANKNPPIAKNQWQCPDPSCGTINSDQKESCVKCNMPSKIKVAQRKPNTFLSKPASKECNQSQTASFLPTPATVPSTTTGGRGRGQKAQARLAMLRQPKPDSDNGIGKTSGDRIQHLEQTLATSRSSVNMDHHLIAVFRLRKELKKNRLLALSHRSSQLVEAATTALTRSSEYCTQGGRLLEDYQRLKKEISFYLKWKSEVDTGKDESLAAMKEMAFNGAAKGLSKSVEKYLADFPQDDMKDVLTQVDESLGTILKNHEFLVKSNAKEWDMKSIGGDDAAVEKIAYSSKDDFYALTTAFATMKRALEEEEEKQTGRVTNT